MSRELSKAKIKQAERRNMMSSFFVTLLIGLAYEQMASPVRESISVSGITFGTFALVATFFVVSIRFFVGNQLHLLSESLTKIPGLAWLYDLIVIILQSTLLVFIGGDTTIKQNQGASIGFAGLLIALYVIDVLWIVSQWALGKLIPGWKRAFIPWVWGILNTALVVCVVFLSIIIKDIYSTTGLAWLLVLNFLAFVVDVILVDYYDVI